MNKKKIIIITILIFILILICILAILMNKNNQINNLSISKKQAEETEFFSYIVYDNQDEENIKTLITINSENGIDYIEKEDGKKIYGYGKNKIVIDYLIKKDEEKTIKIKEIGVEEQEKKILVNDDAIGKTIQVEKIAESQGYKTINIANNIDIEGYKTYYQIGKNAQWVEGSGKISMLDYDLTTNNLINEDDTVTITGKIENSKTGNIVQISKQYQVDTTSTISSFEADSLIDAMEKYDFGTGKFKVTVSDETYSLKVYSFDENQKMQVDTVFGTEEDVATASAYAQNMIVVKVNGDLTIEQGATLTAYASANGYGGPKGMMIYCTGTLTNNGTISMTARGAKAEGQNVYLWKNEDESYEYVPATGASGGASVVNPRGGTSVNGKNGANGTARQTGGGASGTAYGRYRSTSSGSGSSGTSYSGGTGGSFGATVDGANYPARNGEANGGAGGVNQGWAVGARGYGAGNPTRWNRWITNHIF